jgi:hypothetical protein
VGVAPPGRDIATTNSLASPCLIGDGVLNATKPCGPPKHSSALSASALPEVAEAEGLSFSEGVLLGVGEGVLLGGGEGVLLGVGEGGTLIGTQAGYPVKKKDTPKMASNNRLSKGIASLITRRRGGRGVNVISPPFSRPLQISLRYGRP